MNYSNLWGFIYSIVSCGEYHTIVGYINIEYRRNNLLSKLGEVG